MAHRTEGNWWSAPRDGVDRCWYIASTALHQRHDSYKTNAPWSRQYNHLRTHERTHSPYTQEFTMLFRSQHIHSVVNTVSQSSFLEYNVIRQCMCLPQWWRWRVHPHALPTQDKIRSPRSCRARPSGFSTSWSQLVLRRRSGRDDLHLLHLGQRLVHLAEEILLAEPACGICQCVLILRANRLRHEREADGTVRRRVEGDGNVTVTTGGGGRAVRGRPKPGCSLSATCRCHRRSALGVSS